MGALQQQNDAVSGPYLLERRGHGRLFSLGSWSRGLKQALENTKQQSRERPIGAATCKRFEFLHNGFRGTIDNPKVSGVSCGHLDLPSRLDNDTGVGKILWGFLSHHRFNGGRGGRQVLLQ